MIRPLRFLLQVVATLSLALFGTGPYLEAAPSPGRPGDVAAAMSVLRANCIQCHGDEKRKGGLALIDRESALKGGDSGPALAPGKPEQSRLFQLLEAEADPHMPPKKQLPAPEIQTLKRWIRSGAAWDQDAIRGIVEDLSPVRMEPLPPGYHPVRALAFSPDGTRLAIARAGSIAIMALSTNGLTPLVQTNLPALIPFSAEWDQTGSTLHIGGLRLLLSLDPATLQVRRTLTNGLTGRISAIRTLPSSDHLAVADGNPGQSGILRILNPVTGKATAAWAAHADTILAARVSPDGKALFTASADRWIRAWDWRKQTQIAAFEGHTAPVTGIAFNSNATQMVSVGLDKQTKVWDILTREKLLTLGNGSAPGAGVEWTTNLNRILVASEPGSLHGYTELKVHTGEQSSDSGREKLLGDRRKSVTAMAVNPAGTVAALGTWDGEVVALAIGTEGKPMTGVASAPDPVIPPPTLSFTRDVLPALSKAGCNAGPCHAKPEGQNGFKLSVFSFDPEADYAEVVREAGGRRVFPAAPDESLLIKKALQRLPHEGGQRFAPGSDTHRLLVAWIREGMPFQTTNEPSLTAIQSSPREVVLRPGGRGNVKVTATYSDGSRRDVTALAQFDSSDKELVSIDPQGRFTAGTLTGEAVLVTRFMGLMADVKVTLPPKKRLPDAEYARLPVRNLIDRLAYEDFKRLGLMPSAPASDATFLRRASLDAIGILPSPEEVRAFLADPAPDKRSRLVTRLLEHPAYADYWANKWADLFRPNPDRVGVKSVFVLDQWLRESFRQNKPYDLMAREILLAQGSNHRAGPAVIYRDRREPAELTTMFSQIFLGTRLECARCHHHPNEKWSQEDFYHFAAFFGAVKQRGDGLSPPISAGRELFFHAGDPGGVNHPVTGKRMTPRALDEPATSPATPPASTAAAADGPSTAGADPRVALANWMLDPANKYFAKALVNRVWANFFGRGFVEPVDDFRVSNPATHPALLDGLAAEFVSGGYDLKRLMRTIMESHLYQLSSEPNPTNLKDTRHFSRSYRRRLPAEVMVDTVAHLTGVPDVFTGMAPGARAMQAWTYKIDSQFMDAFGRPNASSDCPCERDLRTSVVQSLHLMHSKGLQAKLSHPKGRVATLVASGKTPEEIVTELYLAAFGRPPQPDELTTATQPFALPGASRQAVAEDVLWALINSAEFVFNH